MKSPIFAAGPTKQTNGRKPVVSTYYIRGAWTTPNVILDNWLFSLRSQRGLTPYEQGKRQ